MICKYCGKENREGAEFCEKCGASLKEESSDKTEARRFSDESETYEEPETLKTEESQKEEEAVLVTEEIPSEDDVEVIDKEGNPEGPSGDRSPYLISNAAKKALGSVFVLLGTIALAAQAVLTILYIFSSQAQEACDFLAQSLMIQGNILPITRTIVSILVAVEILMVVGFAMTFVNARKKRGPFNTAGLTILQAVSAAGLIIVSFLTLCAAGAGVVAGRYYISMYFFYGTLAKEDLIFAAVSCAVVLAVLILAIIFCAKLVSSTGRAKKAAAYGTAKKNISLYAAVILIIIGVLLIVFAVYSLFTPVPSDLFIILSEVLLAAACILIAVFIIRYRRGMKEILKRRQTVIY